MELGEYLKTKRGTESLRDISKKTGVSHTYLMHIEKGFDPRSGEPINPHPHTLKRIANGMGIDYMKLMTLAKYI